MTYKHTQNGVVCTLCGRTGHYPEECAWAACQSRADNTVFYGMLFIFICAMFVLPFVYGG